MGLIAAADAPQLATLLDGCSQLQIAAGSVLLADGIPNSTAYVLLRGQLKVTLEPEGLNPIAVIGPGELVGEVSAMVGGRTSAWVIASEACELVELERQTLLTLAQQSHHFAFRLLQSLCSRLYNSNAAAQRSEQASRHNLEISFTDQLTQLKNRTWLQSHEQGLLEPLLQHDTGLHLYMIDIDHFKRFNDSWGHATGDVVLQAVAQALEQAVRRSDHVVRLGGEEILVLAQPLADAGAAAQLGEQLRRAVEALEVRSAGIAQALQVTISVGFARHRPGEALADTLERADAAVYRAKEGGRNRVEAA